MQQQTQIEAFSPKQTSSALEPLSSFLRPKTLADICGQKHLLGEGKPISAFLQNGKIPSLLLWGPPGCGKTTLASVISRQIDADFHRLSGVMSKKEDLMKVLASAKKNFAQDRATIVFLDEIHRWNKAQQDVLLPFVEKGMVTLIGATTENPSFSVNSALLSRCRVFHFEPLSPLEIAQYMHTRSSEFLHRYPHRTVTPEAYNALGRAANGDLRNAFNILEAALLAKISGEIQETDIAASAQKTLVYDRDGEEHYNLISAVHKSLRDSDADAACYWIGRMLHAGEDPLYVVRRLVRFASEDIGPADDMALLLAVATLETVKHIGMPECQTAIYQLALRLARAPKDNTTELIVHQVAHDCEKFGNLAVPMGIRNAPTSAMKEWGYGKGYIYAHDNPEGAKTQVHFPEELRGRKYGKQK